MIVKLVGCEGQEWLSALSSCVHDIYHTPGWIAASAHCEEGEAFAVYVERGEQVALFPILKRNLVGKMWDATSAYGFGGPIFHSEATSEWADQAFGAAVKLLETEGCVSWFIRLHPILNLGWQCQAGVVVDHGSTISIDLTKAADEHWRETRSGHKGDIKKSIKAGVLITYDKSEEAIESFIQIYYESMRAVDASPFYFFTAEYFGTLFNRLGDELMLIMAKEGDEYIGGSLFTLSHSSKIMQYYLSGTAPSFKHRQPSKLILNAARKWGRENNYSRLHLGGGVGAQEDALFRFKSGFSPDLHLFQTHRIVINNDKYSQLCVDVDSVNLSGFFPAYREIN